MNKLPEKLKERYIPKAQKMKFFGISLKTLSKEDLMICACMGWEAYHKSIKETRWGIQAKFFINE